MGIKQIHYNLDKINKEDALFNLIVGEKSNGKSYQVKHKEAVIHYWNNKPRSLEQAKEMTEKRMGYRFILMRRWAEDITSLWVEKYFSDVDVCAITDNQYNCITYYRKGIYLANYDPEQSKSIRGEQIGYVMSLNQEQHFSGGSFLDVDRIIFEEFLERGRYLKNEPELMTIFYSTIDRKRGTTKVYMVGNSITKVCPYFAAWGLDSIFRSIKKGEIKTKTIHNENADVKLAIEFCGSSGGKTLAIGSAASMVDGGAWQTFPQPRLPKSLSLYNSLYKFGFFYKGFRFICDIIQDKEDKKNIVFFVSPYYKEFSNNFIVFSDVMKTSPYWQSDIYNISIKNEKLRKIFQNFRECNIFFSDDLCGTDFKQCINFLIRR